MFLSFNVKMIFQYAIKKAQISYFYFMYSKWYVLNLRSQLISDVTLLITAATQDLTLLYFLDI